MKLSELIIRRKIRRILQEAVPTSTAAQGTYGYTALRMTGGQGKLSLTQKIALGVLGAIGARVLYGIITGPSSPARDAKTSMKAVICGDSQGKGPLGIEVGKILTSKGYSVSNVSVNGANPGQVLSQVQSEADNAILVVAIFGGNTTSVNAPADAVVKMYEHCEKSGTAFMAIGPPNVTTITDPDEVSKRGSATYWLDLPPGDMHSDEKRREISDAMEAATASNGEAINVYGVATHWTAGPGGNYPDQPDGLHCIKDADKVAQAAMNALGIDNVTAQLKKDINAKGGTVTDLDGLGMAGKSGEVTEFSNLDFNKFKRGISASEGNYKSFNKSGGEKATYALGKYQFLPSYHWADIKEFAKQNNNVDFGNHTPTSANGSITGFTDWDMFLDSPQVQEDYMDHFIRTKLASGTGSYQGIKNYEESRNTGEALGKLDLAQILAASHFSGFRARPDINERGINSVPTDSKGNPTSGNSTYAAYLSNFTRVYY